MTAPAALFTPSTVWTAPEWPTIVRPEEPLRLEFDRDEPTVTQYASWTCSCASMAWVMNALGVPSPDGGKWNEWHGVNELRRLCGQGAVSPSYGLAYASGVDLERVYNAYGFTVERMLRPDWFKLSYMAQQTIGQIGGARLYHWMGLRGYYGAQFALANPAPGWKGIGDDLSAAEWDAWGGWNACLITGRL